MERLAPIALVASLVAGCSCARSHTLDGGRATDALPPPFDGYPRDTPESVDARSADAPDAPIERRYFTLADVSGSLALERCSAVEGGTAIVAIRAHLGSSCESAAPVAVAIDEAARTVELTPHVWVEHGIACTEIDGLYVREVAIEGLTAGAWTIALGGSTASLVVDPRPVAACTGLVPIGEGGTCFATCDCEVGLECIAILGDAACASRCHDPCERVGDAQPDYGLACADGRECGADPDVGDVCRERPEEACLECGDGMTCTTAPRHCAWAIELNSATRHACTTNDDCETPGLDCVHHADGTARCEVRCTTSDMACPTNAPHACDARGICEWLGE